MHQYKHQQVAYLIQTVTLKLFIWRTYLHNLALPSLPIAGVCIRWMLCEETTVLPM